MGELANRSPGTRKLYTSHLNKFSEWAGASPNELIDMKMSSLKSSDDPRDCRVVENKVKAYLHHLEERGLKPATRRTAYASINSFFASNQFRLSFNSLDRPSGDSEGSRIPEKGEIKMMLHAAKSRRYRALILFLKDSGLRVSDAVRLRWDQAVDYGNGFWGWHIVTKKKKVKASSFIGPEALEALNQLPRKGKLIFPMNAKTASNKLYDIIKDTGLKGITGHGLRKYFSVEMEAARVPEEYRLRMMGKRVGPYDEKRDRILFEEYRRAYDHLKIFGVDEGLTMRIGEVEADNESLRVRIDRLTEENKILKKRMNGITETRRESDTVMDKLFEDPEFRGLLRQKLKELI